MTGCAVSICTLPAVPPPPFFAGPYWLENVRCSSSVYAPEAYAVDAKLGRHVLQTLNASGFDVAHMNAQAEGQSIGHTFITVRTRLTDTSKPMKPIVPILVNTYFPPNVPTPSRCYALGKPFALLLPLETIGAAKAGQHKGLRP
jgi:hypothetical protein